MRWQMRQEQPCEQGGFWSGSEEGVRERQVTLKVHKNRVSKMPNALLSIVNKELCP